MHRFLSRSARARSVALNFPNRLPSDRGFSFDPGEGRIYCLSFEKKYVSREVFGAIERRQMRHYPELIAENKRLKNEVRNLRALLYRVPISMLSRITRPISKLGRKNLVELQPKDRLSLKSIFKYFLKELKILRVQFEGLKSKGLSIEVALTRLRKQLQREPGRRTAARKENWYRISEALRSGGNLREVAASMISRHSKIPRKAESLKSKLINRKL